MNDAQDQQLRNLEWVARYRTLRNWALCLGLVAFVSALISAGFGGGNPKSATSVYSSFALAGLMRWAVAPLLAATFALVVVGALFHAMSKRGHGEV